MFRSISPAASDSPFSSVLSSPSPVLKVSAMCNPRGSLRWMAWPDQESWLSVASGRHHRPVKPALRAASAASSRDRTAPAGDGKLTQLCLSHFRSSPRRTRRGRSRPGHAPIGVPGQDLERKMRSCRDVGMFSLPSPGSKNCQHCQSVSWNCRRKKK